jgi:cyclin-dependent kinase 7
VRAAPRSPAHALACAVRAGRLTGTRTARAQELKHENVLALIEVFPANGGATLSMVLEFVATDLEKVINKSKEDREPFIPAAEIKAYMKMLMSALHYCHSNYVLHRDLKPANLLITAQGVLKLCDFGLARTFGSPAPGGRFSPEAITIWYRPMELLLGADRYGPPCDMWVHLHAGPRPPPPCCSRSDSCPPRSARPGGR